LLGGAGIDPVKGVNMHGIAPPEADNFLLLIIPMIGSQKERHDKPTNRTDGVQ